ncbi:MAG: hypothetical protein PWR22_1434 [Moorella sp. (in: firmicutes)]|jgi:hypothetical protein|uniref:hypothetical protein n=1 Tax=unclassified Neomoorella TaxID=2676739 RepID=UPI0010FFAB7E|nr:MULTISPECIES: hypothetical protein [unclassified Moorella (in: firmicutes)]MDK2816805.1 hypothetical protein [Moorella sp. (in: firmicutes)]MDK2893949.1 hypothetical protein [Moorella sp. (in: firmicutes)]GEA15696.1 hypothetical protein E308F_19400 [Moorella sp. E308F]GEA19446.1 hypothetical protein E306M_25840 [Moorella sp. E306M]
MLTALFKLLQPELEMVRHRLLRETRLQGRRLPGVTWPVLNHLDQDFLPALVLLSAHTQGYSGSRALSLAAVFQFIFLASLIHNNVKDEVALETLVGDYFYTRFFDLLCRDGNLQFLAPLSQLICQIHLDAARQHEKPSSSKSFRMREYLAAAATSLGSQLGRAEPWLAQAWQEIGLLLGKLWNGQPVTVKASQAVEKLAPGTVRELLGELVIQLSEELPVERVMAL